MHLLNLFSVSAGRIWRKRWITIPCVIMFALSLGLLAGVASLVAVNEHAWSGINKSLASPISENGFVNLIWPEDWWKNHNGSDALWYEMIKEIYDLPQIESIGYVDTFGLGEFLDENNSTETRDKIITEQRNAPLAIDAETVDGNTDKYIQSLYFSTYAVWNAYYLPLLEGDIPWETDEYLIYLGYNFRDCAEVGTQLHVSPLKMRIAGVFKENSYIIDPDFLNLGNSIKNEQYGNTINSTMPLDNLMVIVGPEIGVDRELWQISWNSSYTVSEVEESIRSVTDKYVIDAKVSLLEQKVKNDLAYNIESGKMYAKIGMIIGISAVVLILSTQLLMILRNKNELGVLLSQGYSRRDLYIVLFLENFLLIGISSLAAPYIAQWMITGAGFGEEGQAVFWEKCAVSIFTSLIILVIVLSAVSSLAVMLLITRTSSALLLKGEIKNKKTVFTGLFMVSFTVSLGMLYYAMVLNEKDLRVKEIRKLGESEEIIADIDYPDCSDIYILSEKNRNDGCDGYLIAGEVLQVARSTYGQAVSVILDKTEALDYPLKSGVYPVGPDYDNILCCVIGEGCVEDTYVKNGKSYIIIDGLEFLVTGILESNHFMGFDYRIITYAHNLGEEYLNSLMDDEWSRIKYHNDTVRSPLTQEEIGAVLNNLESVFGDSLQKVEWRRIIPDVSSEILSKQYRSICFILSVICLINLLVVSALRGLKQQLENMIMLVNGYSRTRIINKQLAVIMEYEAASSCVILIGVLIVGLLSGNLKYVLKPLTGDSLIIIIGLLIIGVLAGAASAIGTMLAKPSTMLKHTE